LPLPEETEISERGHRLIGAMPGDESREIGGHQLETAQVKSDQHVDLDRVLPDLSIPVGIDGIAIEEMAINLPLTAAPELHLDFNVDPEEIA
jgi:hypothetical protein